MNKKFLSAILFGALMVTSAGTFVSCKDYDDDIENLQGQISANTTAIAELKTLIQNGDYVTNVEVSGQNLVVSFKNAGTKNLTLPECEGGATAEIKDGELYIDGKATGIKVDAEFQEAVKIVEGEWAVLQEDGTYKSTGIKASSIAVSGDEQSGYTLTVTDAEGVATTIKLPTAATLISEIEFLTADYQQVLVAPVLYMNYWCPNATDGWKGPKGDIPSYSNTYSVNYVTDGGANSLRKIRISPASVDASAIDFKLVDTKDVEAAVTLKASRYDGTLTRAAGESGLYEIKVVSGVFTYGSDANKFVKGFKTGTDLANYKALALKPASANYKSLFNVKVEPRKQTTATIGQIYVSGYDNAVSGGVNQPSNFIPQIYVGNKMSVSVQHEYQLYDMYLSASDEDIALFGLEFSEDGRSFKATKSPDNVTDATIDLFVHTLNNLGVYGKNTITVEINRSLGSATYEKQTIMPTKVNDIFLVSADKLKESLGSDLNAWYASVNAGTTAPTVWSTAIYDDEACTSGANVSAGQLTMTLVKDKDNAVKESNIGSALNQLMFQLNINKTTKPLKIGKTYYAKINFTDKTTGKVLNSIVVPFELTKPELSTILVKENGVFADAENEDLAYAYMNATDNATVNSRYLIKRAFVDMATKLANANMTTWSFVENDNAGKVVGDYYTSDLADVWSNSGEYTISLDAAKKDNNGVTLGYKKDLNVAFVGHYLDVAEDTWKYVHTYQFRVMSPIAEGKYQAANDVIEIAATGETNIAKKDVWAFTYNNDVKYELFKVAKFNASTSKYAEAWDRDDIKSVTFSAANTNIFTVVTANPTAIKIKNEETGELERESFVTFKGMGLQAGQESEVNITVEDIWGYKLSAKVKVKTTVNTGN